MTEYEQKIIELADADNDPVQFLEKLNHLFNVPKSQKGSFLLEVGKVLYNFSYLNLTLTTWKKALKCLIRNHQAHRL